MQFNRGLNWKAEQHPCSRSAAETDQLNLSPLISQALVSEPLVTVEVHTAPRRKKKPHLGQHLLSFNHAAPLSNSLTARTSTLYLFSILHLQARLKYVLADLKLKATLVGKYSVVTRANIYLENYFCHLSVGQAPGIQHSTCSVFLQSFSFSLCPVQLHRQVLVPANPLLWTQMLPGGFRGLLHL